MSTPDFNAIRERMGVAVPDELLLLALSHPSAVGEGQERTLKSNQRLEFLGDAVLGAAIAAHLYEGESSLPEGELTLRKAALVKKTTLARAARRLQLGGFLALGRGEDAAGGREREAILADALEALIGALFLAQGFAASRQWVLRVLAVEIEAVRDAPCAASIKNVLQEYTQASGHGTPAYETQVAGGLAHARRFASRVLLQGHAWGEGEGASKQAAECAAARQAFARLSAGEAELTSDL